MTKQERKVIKDALIRDYAIIRQEEIRLNTELKLLKSKSKAIRRHLCKIDKSCRKIFRETYLYYKLNNI